MDSTSTGLTPEPSPAGYTASDWIKIINNGAAVPKGHPRYPEVRALMDQALAQLTTLHQQQNRADSAQAPAPTPGTAALHGLARGGLSGFGDELTGNMMALSGAGQAPGQS